MFVHDTRLPHVLEPAWYHGDAPYERELARVFRPAWHCVATLDDLPRDGDFITCELLGVPLLLRRAEGRVRAFRNACAHRFSALCLGARGHVERIVCPYHGWAYDDDGALAHVPDIESFRSPPGKEPLIGRVKLSSLALECVGKLVFVSLADVPQPLDERTRMLAQRCFSPDHALVLSRTIEHPCNWKIPIENVLETYHVPHLHRSFVARHPSLVRVFANDGEHELGSEFTEYRDRMGATFAPYRLLVRTVAGHTKCEYRHHHAFPNLIIGETPILSFLQVVAPCGPTRSRSLVRLYLHRGVPVRRVAGQLAAWFLESVLREDAAIYESVQTGVTATDRTGVLGAREERVWAFQRWIAERVNDP